MSNKILLTNDYLASNNTERKTGRVAPTSRQESSAAERKDLTENNVRQIRQKLERAAELIKNAQLSEIARKNAAKEAYEEMEKYQTSIKFEIAPEMNDQLIVKIVRKGTDEVVWQYPPSQTIALQKLAKYMPGIFLNTLI